jgi:hypothetical protein
MVDTDAGRIESRRIRKGCGKFCIAIRGGTTSRQGECVEELPDCGLRRGLTRCIRWHVSNTDFGQAQSLTFIGEEEESTTMTIEPWLFAAFAEAR